MVFKYNCLGGARALSGLVFFTAALFAISGESALTQNSTVAPAQPSTAAPSSSGAGSPLPSDIAAKAGQVKEASIAYLKVKCDDSSTAQKATAQALRDRLREELGNLIATAVSKSPQVQGALDAATDAGEAASKIAADPGASAQDKAAAQAKFEIARTYLNAVAKAQRDQIEAKLQADLGVAVAAAADDCPETHKKSADRKQPERKRASSTAPSRPSNEAPPPVAVGVGLGGGGIGVGGIGITIGR